MMTDITDTDISDIYDDYKPLRNYLRNTNLIDSLGALRWYINYSQFTDPPAPASDMQVNALFYKGMNHMIFLPPWQLAILARELIINAPLTSGSSLHDLRNWKDIASAVNKVKAIDEGVSKKYVSQQNVLHILSKIYPHQQFVWQENKPNKQTMTRYYYIYRNDELRPIFEKFFGISVETHFVLGALAWLNYKQFLGLTYPPSGFDKNFTVTLEDYNLFLKHYAISLEELREELQSSTERKMNAEFFYYFDSLRRYPMILTKLNGVDSHICPVPTYLYWRVTDGIYYELVNEKGFDQAIGKGFKDYIGEVLAEQSYPTDIKVIDADKFISESLPKPDWILVQSETCAFVECKAKRMTLEARTDINVNPATETQLEKLAESIIQCYLAVLDAKERSYKQLGLMKTIFPMVVTMENWYIFGDVMALLDVKVKAVATKKGVDWTFIKDHPYLVLSAQEFETMSVLMKSKNLSEIVSPFLSDKKYEQWQFETYLFDKFPEESKSYELFKDNAIDIALAKLK